MSNQNMYELREWPDGSYSVIKADTNPPIAVYSSLGPRGVTSINMFFQRLSWMEENKLVLTQMTFEELFQYLQQKGETEALNALLQDSI